MSDDQFTKLFKYMEKRFADMEERFSEVNKNIDTLRSSVDSFAKQALELHQEFVMLSRKVDRLEQLIHKVAQKTGVKFDY